MLASTNVAVQPVTRIPTGSPRHRYRNDTVTDQTEWGWIGAAFGLLGRPASSRADKYGPRFGRFSSHTLGHVGVGADTLPPVQFASTPMPGPQGTRGKPTRRDQILAAAAELFAKHGFHGVGIDDIGAALGISGPALYRHFRSKDAMLGEMLTSISEYLLAGGEQRLAGAGTHAERLAALIRFHVDFALDNPALITVQERDLANLVDSARQTVRALQRRYVESWVRTIREVTGGEGGMDEPSARASAHAVFGLINSTPHSTYLNREQMAALLRGMATAALHGGREPVT